MINRQVVDMLVKGMIHVLGGMELDNMRFHHATQNSAQFKIYELFTSSIFHLIFLDHGMWLKPQKVKLQMAGRGGGNNVIGGFHTEGRNFNKLGCVCVCVYY